METPLPLNEYNAHELLDELEQVMRAIDSEGLRHSERCACSEFRRVLDSADEMLFYYRTGKLKCTN
jgi:hypothetical protein